MVEHEVAGDEDADAREAIDDCRSGGRSGGHASSLVCSPLAVVRWPFSVVVLRCPRRARQRTTENGKRTTPYPYHSCRTALPDITCSTRSITIAGVICSMHGCPIGQRDR